jgi:hypothetical protein
MAFIYQCERCLSYLKDIGHIKRIEIDLISGEGGEGSAHLEEEGMFCLTCAPDVLAELKGIMRREK